MNIHKKALELYDSLPHGSKEIAAEKYGTSFWYFTKLISNLRTKEDIIIKAMKAIAEASKEARKNVIQIDNQIQEKVEKYKNNSIKSES